MADSPVPAAGDDVPALPVIRDAEKYVSRLPFALGDGLPRTVGWVWKSADHPSFVSLARGRMGGYKVLEHFPLTEDGWAQAWSSLARADPAAASKVAAVLTERAAADSARRQPAEPDTQPVLIVTTNEVPGHRITGVHGDVFGIIVRARNYFSNVGTSLATLTGGEVVGYTKLLTDCRNQARERLWRAARAKGANAVVAMRFDCNEIAGIMSEVAAYGTAVTVEPLELPQGNTDTQR